MALQRHFLTWDRPLLPQAVEFLAGEWKGGAPLDLSRQLVIVPTKQSGRRLREALAGHAAARGQAVFPPRVLTPDQLLAVEPSASAASRLESLLAWIQVLRAADLDDCRAIFPVEPPARSFTWALALAEQLLGVQAKLAEAGCRLSGVAENAGEGFLEEERWRQLGELEHRYDERLREKGRIDGQAAKIAASRSPTPPEGMDRIIVLATPDPLPLALAALTAHARARPVDVVVFAPEALAGDFDDWGRPLASGWVGRPLDLPDFESRVRLCADPADQAQIVAALARSHGTPEGLLGVGLADGRLMPAMESALRRAGFDTFDPEGARHREGELYHLLASLASLTRDPTYESVETLGRCPAVLAFFSARLPGGFRTSRWLAGLDEMRLRHLPADLAAAREQAGGMADFPELAPALERLEEIRARLSTGRFAQGAAEVLSMIFAERRLDPGSKADQRLAAAASAWADIVRQCHAAAAGPEPTDWWEIALRIFGDEVESVDKPAGALELQGWLEMLWEDAPHLAVAGMNEGWVPQAVAEDPFLPESLRRQLGLRTNEGRLARDAWLLQAMAASRAKAGRLDLLLGKFSVDGEPLQPSRLLLRCAEPDLPARVEFLFRAVGPARPHLAWARAWRLTPRRVQPPSRVAATALRDWLECPFRFYLKHVLRMAPLDGAKSELDDLDFGTLCHSVLERMGREAGLRDCTDADELRAFLSAELDRLVRGKFGQSLTVPLIFQREAARQRLGQAAEREAQERLAGWRIVEVEKKVTVEIQGLTVSGKIDRVDRNERTGAVRVLDYKTSDIARSPAETHLRAPRTGDDPPDWARSEWDGRPRIWADLQLPLYQHALAAEYPGGIACGYFNLPKTAVSTGLAVWEDYPRQLHGGAVQCAEGVCGAIRAGQFWPPSERIDSDRDDFAALFHHGAAASIDWEAAR